MSLAVGGMLCWPSWCVLCVVRWSGAGQVGSTDGRAVGLNTITLAAEPRARQRMAGLTLAGGMLGLASAEMSLNCNLRKSRLSLELSEFNILLWTFGKCHARIPFSHSFTPSPPLPLSLPNCPKHLCIRAAAGRRCCSALLSQRSRSCRAAAPPPASSISTTVLATHHT
jgi:hypothetical protein